MAHDEGNEAKIGDLVRIAESRPISRHKHWRVTIILERAVERGKAVALPAAALPVDLPDVTAAMTAGQPADVSVESEAERVR